MKKGANVLDQNKIKKLCTGKDKFSVAEISAQLRIEEKVVADFVNHFTKPKAADKQADTKAADKQADTKAADKQADTKAADKQAENK